MGRVRGKLSSISGLLASVLVWAVQKALFLLVLTRLLQVGIGAGRAPAAISRVG